MAVAAWRQSSRSWMATRPRTRTSAATPSATGPEPAEPGAEAAPPPAAVAAWDAFPGCSRRRPPDRLERMAADCGTSAMEWATLPPRAESVGRQNVERPRINPVEVPDGGIEFIRLSVTPHFEDIRNLGSRA